MGRADCPGLQHPRCLFFTLVNLGDGGVPESRWEGFRGEEIQASRVQTTQTGSQ